MRFAANAENIRTYVHKDISSFVLVFFCSYVLMFFRVSGKSHSFTHNYMPVCVMPDAGRVAPISASVSFLTSSLSCAIT